MFTTILQQKEENAQKGSLEVMGGIVSKMRN